MSFSGNYMATSFKAEILKGNHDFTLTTGDVFKVALYDNNASFTAATTDYTATNEVSGTGYTAGGATLTNVTPVTSGTTAIVDFVDVAWSSATFVTRGALIYNSTLGTAVVAVLDFGSNRTVNAGTFTITFPAADATSAILRIS